MPAATDGHVGTRGRKWMLRTVLENTEALAGISSGCRNASELTTSRFVGTTYPVEASRAVASLDTAYARKSAVFSGCLEALLRHSPELWPMVALLRIFGSGITSKRRFSCARSWGVRSR
jgi:hypothetical protein